MAQGLFTLRQQVQGIVQKAWNTPVGTYAGSFNGSSQYLTTSYASGFDVGTGDLTLECWVYPTSVSGVLGILSNHPSFTGGGFGMYTNNGVLNSQIFTTGTSSADAIIGTTLSLNTWYHVAMTRSSGTMYLWLNGVSQGSTASSKNPNNSSGFYIGSYEGTLYKNVGYISNVRFVKGTALYTANFAPPTSPLAAITNTQLLTLQNATIIDNSTNAATITNNGSVTTIAAMPFTQLKTPAVDYLVVAGGGGGGNGGGGGGGLLQGSVPVTAGSSITVTVGGGGVGTEFNGGNGNASVFSSISSTGGGGGGSYGNDPATASGYSGGSGGGGGASQNYLSFIPGGSGIVGQGNAGGNMVFASGGAPFTAAGGGGAGTVGLNNASTSVAGNGGAGIASAILGTVYTFAGGGGGGGLVSTGVTGGNGGVGGGGGGAVDSGGTQGTGGTGYNSGGNASASVGGAGGTNSGGGGGAGANTHGAGGRGGSGIVIVSYPDIYAAAASTTGSPTVSTSGSGSMSFNGSSQYLNYAAQTPFAFGTGDFTIEFWAYPTGGIAGGPSYIDFRGTSVSSLTPAIFNNNGTLSYYAAGAYRISGGSSPLTTWVHVAVVRISGTTKMYVDGTQVGSSYTDSNNYVVGTGGPFIGQNGASGGYLTGYMSNIRIVKGTGVYTGTFAPSTVPLQATQSAGTNIAAITGTSTSLLLNSVSGGYTADSSTNSYAPATSVSLAPVWNQLSPFATGLGYKNRVYTFNSSGSITF